MLSLADGALGKSVEGIASERISPARRLLVRLLRLTVAFFVWLLLLLASAFVLLLHLMAVTVAKGTDAMLSALLAAEAARKDVVSSALSGLADRTAEPPVRRISSANKC